MSNQIELRHLRYFLAVAHELHYRKAAERLYISQPGLSRQIKQMEDELGVLLFERNNKKIALTAAGAYLKKEAEILLKNIEDIFEHTKLLDEGKKGQIKLGYVGSAMQNVIPDFLSNFHKKHPLIQFTLDEMNNSSQVEALLKNKIDIGFARLNQVPAGLNIKPILNESFSLVLPLSHKLNENNFNSVKQLKDDSFILFEEAYSPVYFQRVMSIFEEAGFSPKVSHKTVHATTIFRLVENHFGVSVVPTSLKNGYNLDIKFIELKKIPQRAILSLMWNKNNRNPTLAAILEMFKQA